jgi:hypothetical protein
VFKLPRNNRVAKEMKTYNLRIKPTDYEIIQQRAEENGIPMNTLLQRIIDDFIKDEKLTSVEQLTLEQIKSLPIKDQKAILKKLSNND